MTHLLRTLALLPLLSVTGACSLWPSKERTPAPVIIAEDSKPACTNAPTSESLRMLPTRFQLIKDGDGLVWIGLDPQAYENLSRNVNEMRLALNEQRRIISYYEKCVGVTRGEH